MGIKWNYNEFSLDFSENKRIVVYFCYHTDENKNCSTTVELTRWLNGEWIATKSVRQYFELEE